MNDLVSEEFLARVRSFEGQAAGPIRVADDPVNVPMIRHWCQALGDPNPAYTDPEWAIDSVHGGIVAPPTMLQSWTHHDRRFPPPPATKDHAEEELISALAEAGFGSVMATNCEQHYERYLRPGDLVTYRARIESVVGPKRTRAGVGFFITNEVTYTDQNDNVVATMRWTVFRYRPAANSRE